MNPSDIASVQSYSAKDLGIKDGICYAYFAYDIGNFIHLEKAEKSITSITERAKITHKRRTPKNFEFTPTPVRVFQDSHPITVGDFTTSPTVEMVIYDFGAVSVVYKIWLSGTFDKLCELSEHLYDNIELQNHSRHAVNSLTTLIRDAVLKPFVATPFEDYSLFQVREFDRPITISELERDYGFHIARLLRSDRETLSEQEVQDALSVRISYTANDVLYIDWGTGFMVDRDADDVITVVDYANISLMELRFLDSQLDATLDRAYLLLQKERWLRRLIPGQGGFNLQRLGRFQLDAAILFESVTNALKLIGDQYLSRVFRITSERLKLANWTASIRRKLDTLESIYQKISDERSSNRMELLEWIIIILIAVSIVLPFLGSKH